MGFNKAEKWHIHKPKKAFESEDCKIMWGFPIQTNKTFEHNLKIDWPENWANKLQKRFKICFTW